MPRLGSGSASHRSATDLWLLARLLAILLRVPEGAEELLPLGCWRALDGESEDEDEELAPLAMAGLADEDIMRCMFLGFDSPALPWKLVALVEYWRAESRAEQKEAVPGARRDARVV